MTVSQCLRKCTYVIEGGRMNYGAFKERGNGVLNEDRVVRFSATTLPFPASENAYVR
jgi:hypothetical protein